MGLFSSTLYTPDISAAQKTAGDEATQTEATAGTTLADELARLTKYFQAQQAQYSDENAKLKKSIADQDAARAASDAKALKVQQDASAAQEQQRAADQKVADTAAANTRASAIAKTKRIQDSTAAINDQYAGYNDAFYKDFAEQYVAARKPALEAAADETQRKSDLSFGHNGTMVSSAAARRAGFNTADRTAAEGNLANEGTGAANTLKSQLFNQQQSALTQAINAATAMPDIPYAGGTESDYGGRASPGGPSTFKPGGAGDTSAADLAMPKINIPAAPGDPGTPSTTPAAPAAPVPGGTITLMDGTTLDLDAINAAAKAQAPDSAVGDTTVKTGTAAAAPAADTVPQFKVPASEGGGDVQKEMIQPIKPAQQALTPQFTVPRTSGPNAVVM